PLTHAHHLPRPPPFPTRRSSDLPFPRKTQRHGPPDAAGGTSDDRDLLCQSHPCLLSHQPYQPGAVVASPRIQRRILATASGSHRDRKSTRLNSSHLGISYAVFCL